ncbi:MAG: hypothetical protein JXL97_02415 [Bacteroidales bacterium]|nr:hypothetical protein [Bacteroidales bacterium]
MKKFFYVVILSIVSTTISLGQDTNVTLKVTNYEFNGENFDHVAINEDVALSFYNCGEDLCFCNKFRNSGSQSYGKVSALKYEEIPTTNEKYKKQKIKFTWSFENTYDDIEGQAVVTITNIQIGNTVKFVAEIVVLDTEDILLLTGYLE